MNREAGIEAKIFHAYDSSPEELIEMLRDSEIAYCAGNPPMTREVIQACHKLKVIQRSGIGVDSIDLDAATDAGVVVMNIAGYCVEELAVHATGLILDNLRTISWYDKTTREGKWMKEKGRQPLRLSGLTLGIFGLGGSGKVLARMWSGFGTRMIAYDPYAREEDARALNVELVDLDTFLAQADIVSIHAPLTPDTRHIFNDETFGKMKKNAIIVNTSRGPIIDEAALARALREGKIAAAGLDVFEHEPPAPDSPLFALDKCTVLTPHSAFAGREAAEVAHFLGAKLPVEMLQNKRIYRPYVVNRAVLAKLPEYEIINEPYPV